MAGVLGLACFWPGWSFARGEAQDAVPAPAHNHSHGGDAANPLTLGATVYKHMCVFCHGEDGDGGGKAMAYLYPWPRDFRMGVFKYRTTPAGSLPLDEDIFRTISRGVPGTAMPAWHGALSTEETWGVVQFIKKFSKRFDEEKPATPIRLGTAPEATPERIAQGEALFKKLDCARCHGADLKGKGPSADQLLDVWKHRLFIYDLTNPNALKWGLELKDIFMTLTTGIEGTPMQSFAHLSEEERWNLAGFIRGKIAMERLDPAKHESDLYPQKTAGPLPHDPQDPVWNGVKGGTVRLLPLSARADPITQVRVQTMINEEELAVRLEWNDATPNRSSSRHQDFKDAVAVEFALGDVLLHEHGHNEPFFGMGNRGKVVNIWQWRADWQQEIETKKRMEYATEGMQDQDVLIFGGEANPVDALNPFRDKPVEELNAEGFGTLTPQPKTKQNVDGKGVWKDGKWSVVFSRPIASLNRWDVDLKGKAAPVLIAFAVWDGSHADRNGRKVVSMWQRLHLP
jgi:mono/diheme cytochrome c family protein